MLSVPAWAQKNKLNLFVWSEYIDPKIGTQLSNLNNYATPNKAAALVQSVGVSLPVSALAVLTWQRGDVLYFNDPSLNL